METYKVPEVLGFRGDWKDFQNFELKAIFTSVQPKLFVPYETFSYVRPVVGFLLLASVFFFSGKANGQSITQMAKLIGSGTSGRMADDSFGYSVNIYGDYAIVGAPYQDYDDTGGNSITDAGAAYIFHQSGGVWTLQQKVVATDRQANDHFGYSVAMSGNYVTVGAPGQGYDVSGANLVFKAGAAYMFTRSGTFWSQTQKLVATDRQADDNFGYSVDIDYAYGAYYVVVGAPRQDYDTVGSTAINDAGAAYGFSHSGSSVWTFQAKLVAADRQVNDNLGYSVAISGYYAIADAPYQDYDAAGGSTAMNDAGAAYIFTGPSNSQRKKIVATDRQADDHFGASVAISIDLLSSVSPDYAIVGAPRQDYDAAGGGTSVNDAGAAYVFYFNSWSQSGKLIAIDRQAGDNFGSSVAFSGSYPVVGAPGQDYNASGNDSLTNSGAAYVFGGPNAGKVVAADRQADDNFGYSVAIGGSYVLASSPKQDYNVNGIDSVTSAGAVYVFEGTFLSVSQLATQAENGVALAPQPVRELFTITNSNVSLEGTVAKVLDIQGREIVRFVMRNGVSVDASNWPTGLYILRLADGSALRVVKE